MRIDYLEILSQWKNLDKLKVDFDSTRPISVLLGRNGSAKSNLLEALIIIFRNIDLGDTSEFSYVIKYEFRRSKVTLTAEEGKFPRGEIDGIPASLSEIRQNWFPNHVVGYYSGVSDRFEELFRKHDLIARNETLSAKENETEQQKLVLDDTPTKLKFRRFILARPVHGLFALLAFYFSDDKVVKDFLKELPRIEAFDSTLLIVRKPEWARRGTSSSNFWGAKGPVRDLLERIRRHSLVPFTKSTRINIDFAHRENREVMYLYLPDINAVRSLAQEYGSDPRALFQALDTMRLSGLIEDFRVRVRVTGAENAIHTRQLSEGEQQLLTVLGLLRFTKDEGSLYLLDEPDTHLNPTWGVQYIEQLRDIGGIDRNSHTFLATHDPLLVAGLCREEICLLTRTPNGHILATHPEDSPRGRGVAGVLTSPVYGLESQLDPFSIKVLKRIYEVSFEERSPKRARHLRRLSKLVPALETEESSPDPYRNIAREAYKMAQDLALNTNDSGDVKGTIIENLAQKLYKEAS